MTQTVKQFLRPKEAAIYLGVSQYALRKMTEAGSLKRVAGTRTYRLCDLDRLLKGGDLDVKSNSPG